MALAVAVAVLAVLVPPAVTVAPGPRSGQERSAWGSAAGFLTGTRTPETGAPERRASEHRASEAWSATAAVRSGRTANAPRPEGTFTWPLTPRPAVVRPFDPPDSEYGPGHRGVDLAAEPGQPVSAAAAGRVVYAGDLAGRGVVSIEHRGGLRTTYEPLSVRVAEGDRVEAGRRIGTVARGHDGCRRAACLHWGLRRGERYLDPLTVVPVAGPLRLKPWPG
ncbi:M23 family metallopeptidase [Prauserella alba]|uniref:M23ase beta-sheet core domain-containing protein n=1 Tax=Prauserella alba TaxID=176898 RepID=A0ABP4FYQ1_9PSEU|nr:M23 family metallopeptidase [Prauserella alba]